VLFDSFAMELGRVCASPVFISGQEIERRIHRTSIGTIAALVYPEQVKFAWLLTSGAFLEHVTDPAREGRDRRAHIAAKPPKSFLHGMIRNPGE
jgi:hypothetical protein